MIEMIETNQDKAQLTVRISGKFNFKMYREFARIYTGNKGKYDRYILDMRETNYMDTSALGMLLQMREYLDASRDDIHIINCSNQLQSLFEISNFDQLFTFQCVA